MKGIVDRFEGKVAVIEIDGITQDIPRSSVDPGVVEGDYVELINGIWVTNEIETKNRTNKIKDLMNDVWKD
jgi:hydrogenase maturation factor